MRERTAAHAHAHGVKIFIPIAFLVFALLCYDGVSCFSVILTFVNRAYKWKMYGHVLLLI